MNKNSILGCLIGAAAGDAMGAATEIRTREEIKRDFNGFVTDFLPPPIDTFAGGNHAGQITDDFSLAYFNCMEMIQNEGKYSEKIAERALLKWYERKEYNRFCGPTTKASILALMGEAPVVSIEDRFIHNNGRATNGGGMKASPVALFSGGDIDKAIDIAMTFAKITHGNDIALSGAGAIAAATARAMNDDCGVLDLIDAGLYGARRGYEFGHKIKSLAGPSIEKRIRLAVQIGAVADSFESAIDEIGDIIGSGLYAAQAIPAVFGIIVAVRGNVIKGIQAAVNIGDDTDTVATMVGGILGAFRGSEVFPNSYIEILERENDIKLLELSEEIRRLIK